MSNFKEFWYDWMGGNDVIFLGINSIRGDYYDDIIKAISWVGDHHHFVFYLGLLLVYASIMLFLKFVRGKGGLGNYFNLWLGIFIMLGAGYAVNGWVIRGLKDEFAFPRPYIALAHVHSPVYHLEKLDSSVDYQSFPSGHVAFTVLMVVALWPLMNNTMRWCGVALIALMCWSRISLGMHFPADVLGAVLISAPLMLLLREVLNYVFCKLLRLKF